MVSVEAAIASSVWCSRQSACGLQRTRISGKSHQANNSWVFVVVFFFKNQRGLLRNIRVLLTISNPCYGLSKILSLMIPAVLWDSMGLTDNGLSALVIVAVFLFLWRQGFLKADGLCKKTAGLTGEENKRRKNYVSLLEAVHKDPG